MEKRIASLTDEELLCQTSDLVAQSRRVEAELVAHLAEVDARRLYLGQACPSMFVYATSRLGLSEAEAYLRITAARASRRFPAILELLADGRLHLSGLSRLAPHLDEGNAEELLTRAADRSKREIEVLVAELAPRPDAPDRVRKLPAAPSVAPVLCPDRVLPAGQTESAPRPIIASSPPAILEPLAPARFKVQFTASSELEGKLARARALLRHQIPSGDLAAIVDRALTVLLADLERGKYAATAAPRRSLDQTPVSPSSRGVPAAVRRAVWQRDGGQCTFVNGGGRRCAAQDTLEFHHEVPFARGGDHSPDNVRLLCRGHNGYRAELDFGVAFMRERVQAGRSPARDPANGGGRVAEAGGSPA